MTQSPTLPIEESGKRQRRAWTQAAIAQLVMQHTNNPNKLPEVEGFDGHECGAKLVELGLIERERRPTLTEDDEKFLAAVADALLENARKRFHGDPEKLRLAARFVSKHMAEAGKSGKAVAP